MAEKRGAENGQKDHGASSSGSRGAQAADLRHDATALLPAGNEPGVSREPGGTGSCDSGPPQDGRRPGNTYKITVVVHVVHNPASPAEKISVAQVQSQIAVLNRDYRAQNTDKNKHGSGT